MCLCLFIVYIVIVLIKREDRGLTSPLLYFCNYDSDKEQRCLLG
jgi:hypothetical protein